MIVTRFAPSPTGFLHIGGARTALFNYLFAKHNNGKFFLRIEDTDKIRSTNEAIEAIIDSLNWLGIKWDEEIIYQSNRSKRHLEVAQELIANGKAYYCYQTQEETLLKKEEAKRNNTQYIYDKKWRDTSFTPPIGVKPVIRLKAESIGETIIDDLVQDAVTFPNSEIEDLILVRSDGTPTYMLAVVVDDHDMNITHVIRGDDHLTNTPKQIQIYNAANWQVPKFAHIPLIHGDDGSKLSKRHGALGVGAYIDMGYLPDAINNYLLRLGWSHGDDEFISKEESIKWFNLESIGKSPSRIDFKKLENVNAHYLKETDNSKLLKLIKPLIEYNLNIQLNDKKIIILSNAIDDLKIRAKNIIELASIAEIFVIRPPIDNDFKKDINNNSEQLNKIKELLSNISDWSEENIENIFKNFLKENNIKFSLIGPLIRILLTSVTNSPGIFRMMNIFGKEEVLNRMNDIEI